MAFCCGGVLGTEFVVVEDDEDLIEQDDDADDISVEGVVAMVVEE